jgi:hypothetical protein
MGRKGNEGFVTDSIHIHDDMGGKRLDKPAVKECDHGIVASFNR